MSKIFEALQLVNCTIRDVNAASVLDGVDARTEADAAASDRHGTPAISSGYDIRTASLDVGDRSPLLPFDGKDPHAGEQYRILRTRVIQHPLQPRVVVVASAAPSDGKSTTAINLAWALALRSEVRVLLVDADIRRGVIGQNLGIASSPGLAEYLTGQCEFSDATVQCENLPNLHIVPAGKGYSNPCELLDSERWRATCASVRESYRFVVVDSPPIGTVADYELLQSVADGVLLVIRPDNTNRRLAIKALEAIPKAKLMGVVLNCVSGWLMGEQDLYGGRYYESARKDG